MNESLWLNSYPKTVPTTLPDLTGKTLISLVEEALDRFSTLHAFENMGKTITFKELDSHTKNFASFLTNNCGLKKGDKVAIQMPNVLQYPVALFGILRAGMVVVNTNPLYTSSEMEHQFNDSGAKAVVILANFACNLQKILHKTGIEKVIIAELGDMLGGFKGTITNFVVKKVKKMVPPFHIAGAIPFMKSLKMGSESEFRPTEILPDDIAFLQYTGGTTGVSKGAMLSHGNMVCNLIQVSLWNQQGGIEDGKEVYITALPLYHIFALTVNALNAVYTGAKNVLITNPRDNKGFVNELKKHKFTIITGVNTLFKSLLNNPDFKNIDFSALKFGFGGGMSIQKVVAEQWVQITGAPLTEGYGLTETSPVVTVNPLDGSGKIGTIGLPIPGSNVKLLDDNGKEVQIGDPGELCISGPQVMKGYWNRPKETEEAFIDGWFKTGDVAIMDDEGYFTIVDRKKEMILVSGFNVYPNEIENVIASHPKVLEVGAIGVPDKKSIEAVKVVIVKKDNSLTDKEVISYAKEHLTPYKCPKHVSFVDDLPKSNVGKILRRIIKENDLKEHSY